MVWAYGFRPFFLLLPLAAVAAVVPLPLLWLGGAAGAAPGLWHGHEQVFGMLSAGLAGFLLTALPSWTGTRPLTGMGLKLVVGLWLAGRAAFWLDGVLPPWLVAGTDAAFLPVLLAVALPALAAAERNPWEFVAAIGALAVADAVFHLARLGLVPVAPERVLFAAVILYLALIAMATGRILPVTIRSALAASGELPQLRLPPGRRHLATATLLLVALGELLAPDSPVTGWLALAAACAQADRMAEMHRWAALRHPQVALFHLSHAWMVLGLGGLGLSILGAPLDPLAMRHALGPGAATTAVMAVMSVVSLRHTGRPFPLPAAVWVPPLLIGVAAALRVAVPHLAPQAMALWGVTVPALFWSAGFVVWWWRFAPWLRTARVDGQPG